MAILSKYGPENVEEGQILIENLSRTVWEAQQDDSDESGSDDGSGEGDPQNGSDGDSNGS